MRKKKEEEEIEEGVTKIRKRGQMEKEEENVIKKERIRDRGRKRKKTRVNNHSGSLGKQIRTDSQTAYILDERNKFGDSIG